MKQIKRTIAIILCLIMAIGSMGIAFGQAKDYEGHWAEATIEKWIEESKITGYQDGTFRPDGNVTRAEFVTMVNKIIDYDGKGTIEFDDVKSDDWFYDQVRIAQEIGYISGYSATEFGPNDNITREQAAAILARIQYLKADSEAANKFTDNTDISSWAVGSVGAASSNGFIKGHNDGSFKPKDNLSRAEAVTMLDNVLLNAKNYIVYRDGTVLNDTEIPGDLIIAKTVGDGDVYLNNIDVKGHIYVYGGGTNSVYFNNVKVARIEVDKDKVRLVFDDGTAVEEIALGTEAKLENINGEIAKVTVNSDGKVTFTGKFADIEILSKLDIELSDATIENLVVNEPIKILGKGTVATLTANVDGIQYDSTTKITKTVVGENVTEKPAVIKEDVKEPSSPSPGPGPGPSETKYSLNVTAELKDNVETISEFTYTTQYYESKKDIYEVINTEVDSLKDKLEPETNHAYYEGLLKLDQVEAKLDEIDKEELWDRITAKLAGTIVLSELENLKEQLLNEEITIAEDILPLISLYTDTYNTSSKAYTDLGKIISTLKDSDLTLDSVTYKVTYNSEVKDDIEAILLSIEEMASDNKITPSEIVELFGKNIIVEATRGEYTVILTIKINEL